MVVIVALLCGIPGSGKTTLAKCIVAEGGGHHEGWEDVTFQHVAFDDGIADKSVWTEHTFAASRQTGLDLVNKLIHETKTAEDKRGSVIIVDDIMYLHSMRREVYVTARNAGADHFLLVHADTTLDVALARNAARDESTRVDDDAIRRMYDRFEKPNGKRIQERVHLTIDTSNHERY
jgi:tRNA uridine 5-carbamoylmethylation protein Kti12